MVRRKLESFLNMTVNFAVEIWKIYDSFLVNITT